jgi:alpha-beta hydrolase superfamily lysophospholipase
MLYLYGGNDQVVPKRPTQTVMNGLGSNTNAKLMTYPTGYHMLLRDLNAQPRWADVAQWIEERSPRKQMVMAAE